MENKSYSMKTVQGLILEITRQMLVDNWKPDYILGVSRGGLVPAMYLSHYLNVPVRTINVAATKKIIIEDSFIPGDNTLIVDDINDTGKTITWIRHNTPTLITHSCDVRFAVLINNDSSTVDVDYAGMYINKLENPEWCIFPWEEWWK